MISMSLIAFSVFNIVKFANDACEGSDSKVQKMTHIKNLFFKFSHEIIYTQNGTCYTEDECEDKGGKASGTCAEGNQ